MELYSLYKTVFLPYVYTEDGGKCFVKGEHKIIDLVKMYNGIVKIEDSMYVYTSSHGLWYRERKL